jgi:nucleoside 2-deoxyribosyltransferase
MERTRNSQLRDAISEWVDVYLPQEDGQLVFRLLERGMSAAEARNVVFKNDIRAIDECDLLILIMDGRTIDEGACFELGYAFAQDKVCIGVKTDQRMLLPHGDNPMIEAPLREIFFSDLELVNWLRVSFPAKSL